MNLADQFRAQMAHRPEPTARIFLPVPELGADFKFECVVRRLDLLQLLHNGVLPERLAHIFLTVDQKNPARTAEKLSEAEDTLAFLTVLRKLAVSVCVDPRIVYSEAPKFGEVAIHEVPTPVIHALANYALSLSPDVPVSIEAIDGTPAETTVGAVETFPAEQGELSPVLPDGAGHPEGAAVGAPAAA